VRLELTDIALSGEAIGNVSDRQVLVPGGIPGELVEVRIRGAAKDGRTRAELLRVVTPSPHRVTPLCRHFGPCGGCAWQHIAYHHQLRLKRQILQSLLATTLGGDAPAVEAVIGTPAAVAPGHEPARTSRAPGHSSVGSPAGAGAPTDDDGPWGYRNKVHFVLGPDAVGRLAVGHYKTGSQTLLPVVECPVHAEDGNRVAFAFQDALNQHPGQRSDDLVDALRHIVVRVAERSGETLATLVVGENVRSLRPVVRRWLAGESAPDSLHLNIHPEEGPLLFGPGSLSLHGRDRLLETIEGISFLISPTSFFQTNLRAARELVRVVLDAVPDHQGLQVLDLFAGVGLFALPLARRGALVTAVEENAEAVGDGVASRRINGISERACRFISDRVEKALERSSRRLRPDVVVLDPPRQGCPGDALRTILDRLRSPLIVYVSCSPEALASDLGTAVAAGYRIAPIRVIDMFPHTAHIESVAVLRR
jgi:23S rRNA (uracil1939-C5)-methyltransferase